MNGKDLIIILSQNNTPLASTYIRSQDVQTDADMLEKASDDFGVPDCFAILKTVSQEVCPTVVSMVFDVTENTVYWCENRQWKQVEKHAF